MFESMFKQKTISPAEALLEQKKSFQQWLPIEDVDRGFIKVKNPNLEYYPVIRLGNQAVNLMSDDDKYVLAKNLEKFFASISSFQSFEILILPMPFDLDEWLAMCDKRLAVLQNQQMEVHRKLVESRRTRDGRYSDYAQQEQAIGYYVNHVLDQKSFVQSKLSEGDIVNKRAYFIPKFVGLKSLSDYQDATTHVVNQLNAVIPGSEQCNSQDIRNILFSLLNPTRKQYYKVPSAQTSPIYETTLSTHAQPQNTGNQWYELSYTNPTPQYTNQNPQLTMSNPYASVPDDDDDDLDQFTL